MKLSVVGKALFCVLLIVTGAAWTLQKKVQGDTTHAAVGATDNLDQAVVLKRPKKISVSLVSGENIRGTVLSFSADGVVVEDKGGEKETWKWDTRMTSEWAKDISGWLDRRDAQQWLLAGSILISLDGGVALSEDCFKRALRLDKSLETMVKKAKNPDRVNRNRASYHWPYQGEKQQLELADALKAKGLAAFEKMGYKNLKVFENHQYVFISSSKPAVAKGWFTQVSKVHSTLSGLFNLDKRENIFSGKCLVVHATNEKDYLQLINLIYGKSIEGSAGLNVTLGTGENVVFFFDAPTGPKFTQVVLAHEMTHAFIARFHGRTHLKSWINEGLAEYCSKKVSPHDSFARREKSSRKALAASPSLASFYKASNIDYDLYGLARMMTEMMIAQKPKGYANFVLLCKEGVEVEKAIQQAFGVSLEKWTELFGKAANIKGLKI